MKRRITAEECPVPCDKHGFSGVDSADREYGIVTFCKLCLNEETSLFDKECTEDRPKLNERLSNIQISKIKTLKDLWNIEKAINDYDNEWKTKLCEYYGV